MVKITLEVSEELSEQLTQLGDVWRQAASLRDATRTRLRLPEFLALSLEQPPLPTRVYQSPVSVILQFFAEIILTLPVTTFPHINDCPDGARTPKTLGV